MISLPHDPVKTPGPPPAGVVDTHFHVFPRLEQAAPGARYLPRYGAALDAWARGADACGVSHGVAVQPSFLGTDNTALLDALAAMPQRLRGVAVLDAAVARAELDRLDALGVRGVRLNLVGRAHRIDPAQARLLERIGPLGWHVEVHADTGGLAGLLAQLPTALPVVIDHFGKPHAGDDAALWQAVRRRADGLHVKLSAPYRLSAGVDAATLARRWLAELGAARLLWGSDWPCTNHEAQQAVAQAPACVLDWLGDAAALRQVLVDNPRRLYRFGH